MIDESFIDRRLVLTNEADKQYLLDKVRQQKNFPYSIVEIDGLLRFLIKNLGEEWVTVHNNGHMSIKVSEKNAQGFSFFIVI